MTQSVSILKAINKNSSTKLGIFTSKMFRETPDIYSIQTSNADKYLLPIGTTYSNPHRLPKLGESINVQILEKILKLPDKAKKILKKKDTPIWIRTSGNYWYNAWDREPYKSSKVKKILIDERYFDFALLLINSSLFYFWFRVFGDGRDMNLDILEEIRIPDISVIQRYEILSKKARESIMSALFSVFDAQMKRFITSKVKDKLDLADFVLGKCLYQLTYEEIYHILNYDKEVRTGIKLPIEIKVLIDQILTAKKQNPEADTTQWEKEIDQLVYKLYDLTPEEIKIIEGGK